MWALNSFRWPEAQPQLAAAQLGRVELRARYGLRRRVDTALNDGRAVEERRFSINKPRQPPVNVQGREDLVSFGRER